MLPLTIRSPPSTADYMPLADYESQTPASFVQGKPVLHYHLESARILVPKSQQRQLAIFPADDVPAEGTDLLNGDAAEETVEQSVELFVNSESFTAWNPRAEVGVSIPYLAISIHAVKQVKPPGSSSPNPAVWMQLELSGGGDDDEEFDLVELTVIPPVESESSEDPHSSPAHGLYEAMAACSNLHVDPNNEEDDEDEDENYGRIVFDGHAEHEALDGFTGVMRGAADGGLPPPMPGSGGWITAENLHEYFDVDGNWIGQGTEGEDGDEEELGEGAGRTRARDEVDADGVNGHRTEEDAEAKRARTE